MAAPAQTSGHAPARLRDSRVLRLGVAGALLLYGGLVLVSVIGVPLFGYPDERAHVDYAWQVAHGHLPVAGLPFTAEFPQLGQVDYVQHVANHPPLYYVITGPFLRLTDALGHPAAGLYGMRLFGALLTALTVLVIGRLAAVVTAGASRRLRTATIVLACALTASNPALVASSGAIQNDALAVLFTALVVTTLAEAARGGLDRRGVALVALFCTLGMLTRITYVTVAALAVAAVAALTLWPDLRLRRPTRALIQSASYRVLAVGATIAAGAGWFVALNLHRYGDITGGEAIYSIESIESRHLAPGASGGLMTYLLNPYTWWVQLRQMVGPTPAMARASFLFDIAAGLLLVVLLAGAWTIARHRTPRLLDRPGRITLAALALVFLAAMAKLADHVVHRGSPNLRYLLDAIGLWAVGGAVLLLALRRLAPHAVVVVGALSAIGTLSFIGGTVHRYSTPPGTSLLRGLRDSLSDSRVPGATYLVAGCIVLAAVGLAMVVTAIVQTVRAEDEMAQGAAERMGT